MVVHCQRACPLPGLAGIRRVICSDTPGRKRPLCLCYKSWVQRWIGGISVTAKILNDMPSSEKEKEEKPEKEEKEKPTTSREEYELACIPEARRRKAKLTTAVIAWRRRSVKVLPEKIMPVGLHFRGANGAAA